MDTILLRRSKTDRKADGSLLVPLPTKTVLTRQVELAEEERFCYAMFRQEACAIVARFAVLGGAFCPFVKASLAVKGKV